MQLIKPISIFMLSAMACLSGCSKDSNAKTIPENSYTDEKKCHVKGKENEKMPVIYLLVSEYNDSKVFTKDYMNQEIKNAIARGCDINEVNDSGLNALNLAVMLNADEQIKNLIAQGANPNLTITSSNRKDLNGLNSFQFSELLLKKKPSAEREKTNALVQSYKK